MSESSELSGFHRLIRVAFLAGLVAVLLVLRAVDPTTVAWLPLRTSCGAITGLPCIFCGTTRAIHFLLQGDFSRALYFNWLAYPALGSAIFLGARSLLELVRSRRLRPVLPPVRFTRTTAWTGLGLLLALWVLQVSLALLFHKHELLNPNGPLYALLVRHLN